MPEFIQVDSFSRRPFRGNPAVILEPGLRLADEAMQAIAAEMNVSETAFLEGGAGRYDLRWFTPEVEVDLCGHATLAAAHALWTEWGEKSESITFSTRSGELTVVRDDADPTLMWMDFPSEPVTRLDTHPTLVSEIEGALNVDSEFVGSNRMDILVEVDSESTVANLSPDFNRLLRLEARGIIVTARADGGKAYDFVSRFFAPAFGINEDPVTGSAHCALAPYWSDRIGKAELTGYQASKRTGVVRTRLEGDRVKLGGSAVTVFSGDLRHLD